MCDKGQAPDRRKPGWKSRLGLITEYLGCMLRRQTVFVRSRVEPSKDFLMRGMTP